MRATPLRTRLAPLLGAAFLDGEWSREALIDAAARLLGRDVPGIEKLVTATLATFRSPPRHELHVLVAFVAARTVFWKRLAGQMPRLRMETLVPGRVAMVPTPPGRPDWGLPVLDTERDLADLLEVSVETLGWFAASLEGKPWRGAVDHYRHHFVRKAVGERLLEAPMAGLKAVQRRLLRGLLDRVPAHAGACGFVRGRSVVDHARVHVAQAGVLCLDLEDFFSSVSGARVFGTFHAVGYPETVSRRLAELCTHRTPRRVFRHLLPPETHEAAARRSRQKARLLDPHLPQGAPTSPALANLVAFRLDVRLAALAASAGLRYSRYADDLAFSGGEAFAGAGGMTRFALVVARIVRDEGFRLHAHKTRRMGRGERQSICGVVVNQHANLPRDAYDRLKAILYNCVRQGPASQNRGAHSDFRSHLLGRIAWAGQLNPPRGAKLRALFDRIVW